ncbi:hypothetical protein KCM76_19385 [Zooshikella marina]|uniref:hypothetical protein n=1 Tax=Zooshikella ganghwensis TaxID=202772 RepID=UPI001BB0786B|nr:hypothetical protein [Zooshikella ganghwensis]MBU2708164.1 hypothetical protein [Zooshikella ganghwensis]
MKTHNSNDSKHHSSQASSGEWQQLASRRRLLKASAAAAPLLLTLRSGAALAASSATCQAKLANTANQAETVVRPGYDIEDVKWLRAEAVKITVMHNPGKDDKSLNSGQQVYYVVKSEYYQEQAGGLVKVADQLKVQKQLDKWQENAAKGNVTILRENVRVLVFYDDQSKELMVERNPGSSPVTESCWVSLYNNPVENIG